MAPHRSKAEIEAEYTAILERPIGLVKDQWTCGGHSFRDNMRCKCGRTFRQHQKQPRYCLRTWPKGRTHPPLPSKKEREDHGSR